MKSIYYKEINAFLSSLSGYVALLVFVIASGLFLWVLPDSSILQYGYATMEQFFRIAPWLLLFLIPAVTMRSFADEFKSGTIEWLSTKPISYKQIILGKFWASFTLVAIALIPTFVYVISINWLAIADSSIDYGAVVGSYIGLFLLVSAFTAIGTFCSSLTDNQIISFLASLLLCFLFYSGFEGFSRLGSFQGGWDYYLTLIGMDYHYNGLSRGWIDTRNIIYFLSIDILFLVLTHLTLEKRRA